jgi:hypothetical protein
LGLTLGYPVNLSTRFFIPSSEGLHHKRDEVNAHGPAVFGVGRDLFAFCDVEC